MELIQYELCSQIISVCEERSQFRMHGTLVRHVAISGRKSASEKWRCIQSPKIFPSQGHHWIYEHCFRVYPSDVCWLSEELGSGANIYCTELFFLDLGMPGIIFLSCLLLQWISPLWGKVWALGFIHDFSAVEHPLSWAMFEGYFNEMHVPVREMYQCLTEHNAITT
jgi:hypothetical protein